jgi:hypothetical protein
LTKQALKDEAIKLRMQNISLKAIAETLNVAKSTCSLWLRDMPIPDEVLRERMLQGTACYNANRSRAKVLPDRFYDHVSTVKRGKAAELLFLSECLLAGLDCYVPATEDGRVDVIIGSKFVKIQVKIIAERSRVLRVRKIGHNSKTNRKIYHYTASDVDYFVGVDLSSKDIYIVPPSLWLRYQNSISVQVLERHGCKNNMCALFEAVGG